MLYLVSKTQPASHSNVSSQKSAGTHHPIEPYKQRFLSDFQEQSANLFSFYAQDARYDLRCSLLLDIQDVLAPEGYKYAQEDGLIPMVVGDFPSVNGELLYEKAFGNEYIQEILMSRFYLNVLESLFLYCEEMNASGLMLTFNDHNLSIIEIYRPFIISEVQAATDKGVQTQIIISTDIQTYDDLVDHIEKVNQNFRQTLWRKQWGNPVIREYLKTYALTDF
jgi:hypothetical protein